MDGWVDGWVGGWMVDDERHFEQVHELAESLPAGSRCCPLQEDPPTHSEL